MTLRAYRNQVRNLLGKALSHCMDDFLYGHFAGRKFQEPDYTAGLAIGIPRMLDGNKQSRKLCLRFGGCYIHQKPYVTCDDKPKPKSCELGDLLVLCRIIRSGQETFRSAFLQMKMANGKHDINKVQLRLYKEWPRFWFGRSKDCIGRKVFDIKPKAETRGAMYSFVHLSEAVRDEKSLRFTVVPPSQCIVYKDAGTVEELSLQDFLAGLVVGEEGREIIQGNAQNESDNTWSDMIRGVIAQIKGFPIIRRGILSGQSQTRIQGRLFEFLNDVGLLDDSLEVEDEGTGDWIFNKGMGVLVISGMDDFEKGRTEMPKDSCERLKRVDVVDRLLKLGYKASAVSGEYKISDPQTGNTHTVQLKKYKRSYTFKDVKDLLNKVVCCAKDFWDGTLPRSMLFLMMALAGCEEDEKGVERNKEE